MSKAILMSIRPQYVAKILNGEKTIEVRKKFPKDYVGWVYIYCTKGKEKLFRCKLHVVHNIDGTGMHNQYETYTKYGVAKNLDAFQDNIHENVRKQLDITDSTHGELDLYDYVEEYEWEDDELNGKVVAKFWCDKMAELECEFWEEPLFDKDSCYQAVKLIERDLDEPDDERLWNYHEMVSNEDGYTDEEVYRESKFLQKCCLSLSEIKKYIGVGGETRCFGIHISKLEVFDEPKDLKEFRHTCKAEHRGYNRWQPCSKECKNCICNQLDDEGYSQCFSRLTKAPESWYYIEGE